MHKTRHPGRHTIRFHNTSTRDPEHRLLAAHLLANRQKSVAPRMLNPPQPPLQPNALVACNPSTPCETLWLIAREHPDLRQWIIANPAATPDLLEYIAQSGGPHVARCMQLLLKSLDCDKNNPDE